MTDNAFKRLFLNVNYFRKVTKKAVDALQSRSILKIGCQKLVVRRSREGKLQKYRKDQCQIPKQAT
jgi:hypothetical protein